jgi:hypothetical protein
VDRDRLVVAACQHDDFEQVASAVRADDEPSVRVLTGIFDRKGMVDGVSDVLVGDTVLARRVVGCPRSVATRHGDIQRGADLTHAVVAQSPNALGEHADGHALDRVEVDR